MSAGSNSRRAQTAGRCHPPQTLSTELPDCESAVSSSCLGFVLLHDPATSAAFASIFRGLSAGAGGCGADFVGGKTFKYRIARANAKTAAATVDSETAASVQRG